MSAVLKTVLALAAVGAAHAAVTPSAPGPGDSFNEGQACSIRYTVDATNTWKNMSIELMTGSNTGMVHVADVGSGLDGTTGDGTYTWTCPQVTPNSAIYFYQFTNNGAEATWTTRFTIASADGTTTKPSESTQPGGQAIPWGTGRLASGASSGTGSSGGGAAGGAAGASAGTAAPSGAVENGNASVSTPSGRVRGNGTSTSANATGVASGASQGFGPSSVSASSSSSAPSASSNSTTSSTSGAEKMVTGFVAALAGVAGVASLVL